LTIPNIITIGRFVLVPAIILALLYQAFAVAFACFAIAGLSDAVDGYIARQFNQRSEIGAWIDPMADKTLLVSAFVTLGLLGAIPVWLVVIAVSRDILIVGGVVLQSLLGDPIAMKPLFVSKANTTAQITLVAFVLAGLAFGVDAPQVLQLMVWLTALLTVVSGAAYLVTWLRFVEPTKRDDE
jgi:cardiolipin synthase